jgi:hypothetical protein
MKEDFAIKADETKRKALRKRKAEVVVKQPQLKADSTRRTPLFGLGPVQSHLVRPVRPYG